jgi:hypothetical protein
MPSNNENREDSLTPLYPGPENDDGETSLTAASCKIISSGFRTFGLTFFRAAHISHYCETCEWPWACGFQSVPITVEAAKPRSTVIFFFVLK